MERLGLVSQLEGELERIISLGLLPKDGELPSEQSLAKRYGVSRTTAREALLRLAARGLVVQHPGRRARAVALDEALTLENLGLVLHGQASPERRLLVEGYLSLKREVTVELLSACCEHASEAELDRVQQACFALEDAARWEQERPRWMALEFDLLREAAVAAQRPGHVLLVQSLERAFRAMAERVLPCLDAQAMASWARCAREALADKDVQELRTRLPALLSARDERVQAALVPAPEARDKAEEFGQTARTPELQQAVHAPSTATQAPEVRPPGEVPGAAMQALDVRPPSEAPATSMAEPEPGTSAPEPAWGELPGARWANLYGCRTGLCEVPPTASLKEREVHDSTPASDWGPGPSLPASPVPRDAHPERGHSQAGGEIETPDDLS